MTAFFSSAFTQKSTTSYSVLGTNLVNRQKIFGHIVEVEDRRFDQVLVDTARMLIKVRLTGVTKEGSPTMWKSRILAVYDLTSLNMKWSRNFPGLQTILMTDHFMMFSLQSSQLLDVNTGKRIWKISPSLWYVDDKTGMGLSTDSKTRIQGVDLKAGKVVWERRMEKTFTGREVTRLNDTTLLFNDNGLQSLDLRTGQGWIYDAQSMRSYANAADIAGTTLDVVGVFFGVAPTGGNSHVVRKIHSNVLQEDDRLFVAARDRISCITKKGKLVWERVFSKDTMALMSSSSLTRKGDNLYLLNEGHAEINFFDKAYGKPFLASISSSNGSIHFLKQFDFKEPVIGYRLTDSSLVALTRYSMAEYRLKDGSRSRIKLLRNEEPLALRAFAPDKFLFRSAHDTTRYDHIISGDNKHYILKEKQGITVFDQEMAVLGDLLPEDLFLNWLEHERYQFIGNTKKTVVLDPSGRAVAVLNLTSNSWKIGDRVYCADGRKLTIIKLKDIIPPK